MCPGTILNVMTVSMKNDLSFLPNLLKPALFLGGVNDDGRLRVGLKLQNTVGLHRFGQGTLLGVYRWLVLSLISYVLAPKSLFIDRDRL
jgi:hypothetical protein